jgi:hypothetical protein
VAVNEELADTTVYYMFEAAYYFPLLGIAPAIALGVLGLCLEARSKPLSILGITASAGAVVQWVTWTLS